MQVFRQLRLIVFESLGKVARFHRPISSGNALIESSQSALSLS